jgi:hypothetical protein
MAFTIRFLVRSKRRQLQFNQIMCASIMMCLIFPLLTRISAHISIVTLTASIPRTCVPQSVQNALSDGHAMHTRIFQRNIQALKTCDSVKSRGQQNDMRVGDHLLPAEGRLPPSVMTAHCTRWARLAIQNAIRVLKDKICSSGENVHACRPSQRSMLPLSLRTETPWDHEHITRRSSFAAGDGSYKKHKWSHPAELSIAAIQNPYLPLPTFDNDPTFVNQSTSQFFGTLKFLGGVLLPLWTVFFFSGGGGCKFLYPLDMCEYLCAAGPESIFRFV